MEKFTNEEFREYSKKLINDLKIIDRIYNGEEIDTNSIENDNLREVIRLSSEIEQDESINTEEFEAEIMNRLKESLAVDRMTNQQFESILKDDIFRNYVKLSYTRDDFKDERQSIYDDFSRIDSIKRYIDEKSYGYINGLSEVWGQLSSEAQGKFFDEVMAMSNDESIRRAIWTKSKENVQLNHKDTFKELFDKDNIDSSKNLWKSTCPEIQMEEFGEVMEKFGEEISSISEIWKSTDSAVQQEFLEEVMRKLPLSVSQRVEILNGTAPEAKKENEEFILKLYENIDKRNDEIKQQVLEESINLDDEKRKKSLKRLDVRNDEINRLWEALGSEIQNTEKGKDLFFSKYEKVNYDNYNGLLQRTSKEFFDNNLSEIIDRRNNSIDLNELMRHIEYKVSDDALINKKNFSYLYQLKNDGRKIDDKVYEKIKDLYAMNHDLVHEIDYRFLSIEGLLDSFSDEQLLRITNYPEIQDFIYTECYEKNNIALEQSIKYLLKNDNNWIISMHGVIDNITERSKTDWGLARNHPYTKLIDNISSVGEEQITDDFKQQLLGVLKQDKNYFDINNYEDVCNYTNIRNDVCERIFNGDFENIPEQLKKEFEDKNDMYKFALLEHQFGISLKDAKSLVERYGSDVMEFPEGDIKDYLTLLNDIINCSDMESIIGKVNTQIEQGTIQPWNGSVDSRNVEGQIINVFENLYNDATFKPKAEDVTRTDTYIDREGKEHKINICDIDHDFCMRVRVEGAYRALR